MYILLFARIAWKNEFVAVALTDQKWNYCSDTLTTNQSIDIMNISRKQLKKIDDFFNHALYFMYFIRYCILFLCHFLLITIIVIRKIPLDSIQIDCHRVPHIHRSELKGKDLNPKSTVDDFQPICDRNKLVVFGNESFYSDQKISQRILRNKLLWLNSIWSPICVANFRNASNGRIQSRFQMNSQKIRVVK